MVDRYDGPGWCPADSDAPAGFTATFLGKTWVYYWNPALRLLRRYQRKGGYPDGRGGYFTYIEEAYCYYQPQSRAGIPLRLALSNVFNQRKYNNPKNVTYGLCHSRVPGAKYVI